MAERVVEFAGAVIITWPQPRNGALLGRLITITDAATGEPINTVTRFTGHVHAAASDVVWVDLTMFAGEDGKPILDGLPPKIPNGITTGTFPFLVSEMRVASDG